MGKLIIFLCLIFLLYKMLINGLFPLLAKRSLERYKKKISDHRNKTDSCFHQTDSSLKKDK